MKILFISLGCDKNLVDSEEMLGLLNSRGYTFTDDETEADVIIINTCCFINDAKEESVQTILEMAEYKKTGKCKALIVTGCMAQRYKQEILDEVSEVDQVLGTTAYVYKLLPDTAANAMSSVAAADYTLTFRPGYEPEEESAEEWFKKLTAFFDQPQVMVLKKTKKGEKEMDLKPLIYDLGVIAGNDAAQAQLFMKISTGSASNIKPELLLDAYYEALGKERSPFAFMVQREEVYADQASEHEREQGIHSFIPLGALGQDIE